MKWKTNGRTNGKNLFAGSTVELVVTLIDLAVEVTLATISLELLDNAKQETGSKTPRHSTNITLELKSKYNIRKHGKC